MECVVQSQRWYNNVYVRGVNVREYERILCTTRENIYNKENFALWKSIHTIRFATVYSQLRARIRHFRHFDFIVLTFSFCLSISLCVTDRLIITSVYSAHIHTHPSARTPQTIFINWNQLWKSIVPPPPTLLLLLLSLLFVYWFLPFEWRKIIIQ